jgi:hypothetical protein
MMTRAEKLVFVASLFGCAIESVSTVDVHGESYAAVVVAAIRLAGARQGSHRGLNRQPHVNERRFNQCN